MADVVRDAIADAGLKKKGSVWRSRCDHLMDAARPTKYRAASGGRRSTLASQWTFRRDLVVADSVGPGSANESCVSGTVTRGFCLVAASLHAAPAPPTTAGGINKEPPAPIAGAYTLGRWIEEERDSSERHDSE